jgi:hypothetical protein
MSIVASGDLARNPIVRSAVRHPLARLYVNARISTPK